MTCTKCGATIAEKAIVCYRCGTPTAIPSAPRPNGMPPVRARLRMGPVPIVLMVLGALVGVAGLLVETLRYEAESTGLVLMVLGLSAALWNSRRRR